MNIKKNSKNNTYYFSISLGTNNITGNRRQTMRSGFKTKKEAESEYNRLRRKYLDNQFESHKSIIKFKELVGLHSELRKDHLSVTTYSEEVRRINKYLTPYFKSAKLEKITRQDIVDFRDSLINESQTRSNHTINKIMNSLKLIFDTAIEKNYIQHNPCYQIKKLPITKKEMQFWTPDDFKTFISYTKENEAHILYVFFTFAYMTGARLSELLGCRWEKINLDTGVWHIDSTVIWNRETSQHELKENPKTKSGIRNIKLDRNTLELIKTIPKGESPFIFAQETTMPNGDYFTRQFRRIIDDSGVKKIRFHDLRHSHASLLLTLNESDFVVSKRLGHASTYFTKDAYGHLFPDGQDELADKLANLF